MPPAKLIRAHLVRAYDHQDTTTVLGPDGLARRFTGDSAALVRAILQFLTTAHDREELLAYLAECAGAPIDPTDAIDQALAHLRDAGAIREAPSTAVPTDTPRDGTRLVLGLTGAVSSMQAPLLISALQRRHFTVRVAMTKNARQFVAPTALEVLTHQRACTSFWHRDPQSPAPHIQLAQWPQVILVCPATATTLARIAHGDCSDVVSAIAIATRAPVVLVPSMNTEMYTAPAVQRNLETLRNDGFYVLHPGFGPEIAQPPLTRGLHYGSSPPFEHVAEIVLSIVRSSISSGAAVPPDWDRTYTDTPVEKLPWFTPTLEADLVTALERYGHPPARFLDLGTGPGTVAREVAKRGFDVTATDISQRALQIARARSADLPVRWIHDDVLASQLQPSFDIVHDRGCLHVLLPEQRAAYVATISRLTAPGSWFFLKAHTTQPNAPRGTYPLTAADIAALFASQFDLVQTTESVFSGPVEPSPPALFCILRRKP